MIRCAEINGRFVVTNATGWPCCQCQGYCVCNSDDHVFCVSHFGLHLEERAVGVKSSVASLAVHPTMDNVLIRPVIKDKSEGGIYLPEKKGSEAIKWANKGTVLAVGPGRHESGVFVPTKLKAGATVYYHSYPLGCIVEEGGEAFTLIAEKQVVGVVSE